MRTHTAHNGIFFIPIPAPGTLQFSVFQHPGIYHHQFVSAAGSQYIRCLSIQISNPHLVTVLANQISIAVVPFRPVHAIYLFTGHAIQHGEVFTATTNTTFFILYIVISSSLDSNFSFPISIEIVYYERRIPDSRFDTRSHIIGPEVASVTQVSRYFICLSGCISGHTGVNIRFGSTDDIVINTVTVQIR